MHPSLKPVLDSLLLHQPLDTELVNTAFGAIMDGACAEAEIAALLTALAMQGETAADIAGAALAMRARAAHIPTRRTGLLDTCGTGGDHLSTFNISTATAIVVAAVGVPIAKHGNRRASSSSGSADVLEALGVNIELTPEQAGACLDAIGICFCYARLMHGAMQHVAPVRTRLAFRTIFNLLGPLTNPARAEFQLLGANRHESAEQLAKAAARLGIQRVLVVCGNDELDEVALWGRTQVFDVQQGDIRNVTWGLTDLGLPGCSPHDLRVNSPAESAAIIQRVFEGEPGPARNIVLANAAAGLLCAGRVAELRDGVAAAEHAIDSGAVATKLQELVAWSQQYGRSST